MAKSGIYRNGRELLECELENLSSTDRLKSTQQTLTEINDVNNMSISNIIESLKIIKDQLERNLKHLDDLKKKLDKLVK